MVEIDSKVPTAAAIDSVGDLVIDSSVIAVIDSDVLVMAELDHAMTGGSAVVVMENSGMVVVTVA